MDKYKLEQEIKNYENGDFDRDDLIEIIIDMHKEHLSTTHNNDCTATAEIQPTSKSPKGDFVQS